MTGPFTATPDLGAPFKVQSEPFALAQAVAQGPAQAQGPARSGRATAKLILIMLIAAVAGALAFTYRKRPAP